MRGQSNDPLHHNRMLYHAATSDSPNSGCYRQIHNVTLRKEGRKKGNVLFNDALNTFYLRLYGVKHMIKDHSDSEKGNTFRLTATVLLYAPSHRQDCTYYGHCYTSCGALTGTRNSSMSPPHEGSIRRPIAPWANALTTELRDTQMWVIQTRFDIICNKQQKVNISTVSPFAS